MQSRLNPYLHFKGNAREVMEFYRSVFGGKLEINTFKDAGLSPSPDDDDKIMHSRLEAENGIVFMAGDTPSDMAYQPGATITMSLSGDDDAELSGYYTKLSAGGSDVLPLDAAPWGDKFGMFTDKFGIEWMVNISAKKA